MYKNYSKRIIDLIIACICFLLFSPLLILVALVLLFLHQVNPFFLQARPGKNGHLFKVIKFKTMNNRCGSDGNLLPDAERLTTIGLWIRRTSLDELPQLINVIKGDMSLVGPRPLLSEYLPLYTEEQHRRHEVKPGITGWAQINGRNSIGWQQKFEHDIWYVDHIDFLLDFKIMIKTAEKVILRTGISSDTSVTMEMFMGN